MTLCLTFDDGLKAHSEIAAPALKHRGWSGAFCMPTGLMDPQTRKLTMAQELVAFGLIAKSEEDETSVAGEGI